MTDTAVIQVKPGLGDTIWHLPFVRAIAAHSPGGQVVFLSPPSSLARELLAAESPVREVVYFQHGGNEFKRALNLVRLVRLLRSYRFRQIWILDRTTRPAVAARLAGIPERLGLGLGAQRFWITNGGIDRKYFHAFPIDWLKQLMIAQDVPLSSTEPNLTVTDAALAAVATRFGAFPRPWLVFGIGASHPSKEWSDSHWQHLLELLRPQFAGTVFLIGGPAVAARAARLIEVSGAATVNACDLPVMQSAALLKRANLYAGPDSGPLNLAAAVGTRAIGLFGETPPLRYTQFIEVLRADDKGTAPVERIAPERLLALLKERLASA
jgi:heptosyltransferase-2